MIPSPSMTYLSRILDVLARHGELTITNLAMLSRMNHKRCVFLIRWLHDSGYVEIKEIKNKRYIGLTPPGNEYAKCMLQVNDKTHLPVRCAYEMSLQNVNETY
jgi:predicted transcriptional regulator